MPKASINYALAGTMLAAGVSCRDIAPKVGAKNGNSLRVGLKRKGVTAKQARSVEFTQNGIRSATLTIANRAGELLRETFGSILAKHATELNKVPAKANLKQIKRVGESLEPLVRSAKIVHNWGEGEKPTLNLNLITETRLDDLQSANVIESQNIEQISESSDVKPQEI